MRRPLDGGEFATHKINVNVVASSTITTDINNPLYKSTTSSEQVP